MKAKEYDFSAAERGAVARSPQDKTLTKIRIENDILNWFRDRVHQQGGGDYEALINAALRQFIRQEDIAFEDTLRRVIREELKSMAKQAA